MKPANRKRVSDRRLHAADLPAGLGPGTDVLWFQLARPRRIAGGRLRAFRLDPGEDACAGSALGPGGLSARVGRQRLPSGENPCRPAAGLWRVL